MPDQPTTFTWTKQRHLAAQFVAEDALNDAEIAAKVGISPRQLYAWKAHTAFQEKVTEIVAKLEAAIFQRGAARKARRIERYLARLDLFDQVAAERGAHAGMKGVAGGSTGFVNRQLKSVRHAYEKDPDDPESKASSATVEVWEESFDTGLAREMRELEKQLAQDLGQWSEKHELTGANGGPIELGTAAGVRDRLADRIAGVAARTAPADDPPGDAG